MKKFILKTSVFIIPFVIMYGITSILYSGAAFPDLLRIGFLPDVNNNFKQDLSDNTPKNFEDLSTATKNSYDILSIGDSFSEQAGAGYQNKLTDEFTVLHIDRSISKNQLQTLINMINGDFFETYQFKFVILEHVERDLMHNIENLVWTDEFKTSSLERSKEDTEENNVKAPEKEYKYKFFSRATVKFPFYLLPKFYLDKNYESNKMVYNVDLNTRSLFSNHSNKLLFLSNDIAFSGKNNDQNYVNSLNDVLNEIASKLNKKGVHLIFLPAPDKYDMYYDYIEDKKEFPKPIFFDLMKNVEKNYIYIDSKAILSSQLHKTQDLYYYGDSHWTPLSAGFIAEDIRKKIKSGE